MDAIYKAGTYEDRNTAIANVQKLVDSGNAQAAFRLGRYFHLETRNVDYARSMQLYEFAADHGDAWAVNNIGLLYEEGRGVSRDLGKALTLYQQAAEKHHFHGYNNLARFYLLGLGVARDPDKAHELLKKGCDLKIPEVCRAGYDNYDNGQYTAPVDKKKAIEFAVKAASLGDADYQYNLALNYRKGEGTPVDLKKSVELLTPLAEQHHAPAMSALGTAYITGSGVTADKSRGIAMLENAAAMDYCIADLKLGHLFTSDPESKDITKAVHYLEKAYADCDNDDHVTAADLMLVGMNYMSGQFVVQDCVKSLYYLNAAIERDLRRPETYEALSSYYFQGCGGFPSDKAQAFNYLLAAAKLNNKMSQRTVSTLLGRGLNGSPPAPVKADAWGLVSFESPEGNISTEMIEKFLAGKPDAYRKQVMDHIAIINSWIDHYKQAGKEVTIMSDRDRF